MRIPDIPNRAVFAGIFLVIGGLVADAVFYLQGELALEPCPMCILSRYTFVAIAVVALVAAIHGPRNVALKVYGGLIALLGLVGIGISIRHSYLQHFPPPDVACGADLDFIVNTFPLSQALPKIFSGSGSCSKIDWVFLGLTIPEWALVWFAIFTATAIWVAFFRRAPQ
jgi:protein dithiol:quinone oxidoreductase